MGDGGERRCGRRRDVRRESVLLVSTSSETEENQAEPHNTVPTGSLAEYDPSTLKRWLVSPLQTSAPTLLIALC